MATTPSVLTGAAPVPFKNFVVGNSWDATEQDDPLALKEHGDAVSALPSNPKLRLRCYQGTWALEPWVPGIIAIQRGLFTPRNGDVVLASPPKCGTTWLKALAFATMVRGVNPPAGHPEHPLLRLNPHDCVPFTVAELQGGPCGPRTTLRSAQSKLIDEVYGGELILYARVLLVAAAACSFPI